jgi:predicted nucleotidyltransferase
LQREEAYKIAQQCAQFLKERFNVQNVYIFGSVVGDGIWHKRSDIDIAVEGLPDKDYMRALFDMYDLLPSELDLDLVTLENVPMKMRERILAINSKSRIMQMQENRIDRLKRQIGLEFENIEKDMKELSDFFQKNSDLKPTRMEMGGIGSYLQSFYNGIERIFERITVTFDGDIPEGKEWHRLLLEQMEISTQNRPAVISHEISLILLDYLKFRHLFRHIYSGELNWEKLYKLAIKVPDTLTAFKEQINSFINNIKELDE